MTKKRLQNEPAVILSPRPGINFAKNLLLQVANLSATADPSLRSGWQEMSIEGQNPTAC
jgi:hypothetical protein